MKMLLLFVVFIMNLPVVDASSTNSSVIDIGFVQPALVATAAVVGTSLVSSTLESEENEPGTLPKIEEEYLEADSDKKITYWNIKPWFVCSLLGS